MIRYERDTATVFTLVTSELISLIVKIGISTVMSNMRKTDRCALNRHDLMQNYDHLDGHYSARKNGSIDPT